MAGKQLKVKLVRSASGSTERQRLTLLGLGLKKMHTPRILADTPAIRGMINKVNHLVCVEEVK